MAEKLKNWVLPLLFGSSVVYMIIKCYHNAEAFKLTCVFFVCAFFCFCLFELLRKIKKFGGIIYLIIFAAVIYVTLAVVGNAYSVGKLTLSFNRWFYGAQDKSTVIWEYTFALMFMGGFFMISILYYFTQIIYRAFGTMLIMFFPLFIYSKRLDSINVLHFAIVLALYVAVLVHNRQMKSEKNSVVIFNRSYVGSLSLFVAIVIAVTVALPMPDIIAVQEANQDAASDFITPDAPQDLSDTSSLMGGELSNNILFYVNAENPVYLRRQAYDIYDKNFGWYVDREDEMNNKIPKDNENYVNNTTAKAFTEALSKESQNFTAGVDINYPKINIDFPDKEYIVISHNKGFNPTYLLMPLETFSIFETYYERLLHGEYSPLEGDGYTTKKTYRILYNPFSEKHSDFLKHLDISSYELLNALETYKAYYEERGDEMKADMFDDMYREVDYISERFNDTSDVSKNLSELAHRITAGFSSEYEKAVALEGYFSEENFTYDPNVYPDDVDDFVFDKKSGTCGQYATAMTLMARSVGLKARYVEGFVAEEKTDDGNYFVVREYHSHAYVEIYFNGYGWVVFEPTVSGFLNYYKEEEKQDFFVKIQNLIKENYLAVIVIFSVLAVIYLLRKQIAEAVFLLKVKLSKDDKAVIMLYNRLVRLLSEKLDKKLYFLTSAEIAKLLDTHMIKSEGFFEIFEKVCYGHKKISHESRIYAEGEYKRIKQSIRKLKINY